MLSTHVLEVDEDALGRFGPQEGGVLLAAQRADDGLEHQVEFARLGQRAERPWRRGRAPATKSVDRGQRDERRLASASSSTSLAAQVEELERPLLGLGQPSSPPTCVATKIVLPFGLDPAAADLIVAVALLRLAAIDHEVVKQVVVARALPDLRVHDDRAIEADHFVGARGARRARRGRRGR